jgi:hypothetical protein
MEVQAMHDAFLAAAAFAALPSTRTTFGILAGVLCLIAATAIALGYDHRLRDDLPRDDR